jgi:hypothetical protein
VALSRGERRRHARLYEPFPVLARGVDAHGVACVSETVLDDFSAGGLFIRLTWCVAVGAKLFAVVRLTTSSYAWKAAPRVAVRGVVRRVELQPDGTYGVGVAFTQYRFL